MTVDRLTFIPWYEEYAHACLKPAESQIVRAIKQMLDSSFKGRSRDRYRVGLPRVKSANRAFLKLGGPKYSTQIRIQAKPPW